MKISIITVVYNNKEYIETCIQSVIGQSYKNIEYIVIDGGSTDGTKKIINKYKEDIDIFISEKDKGIYDALNKGLQLATGDVIGILHSDDLFYSPDILENIAAIFEKNNIDTLHGDLLYVQKDQPEKIVRYWKSSPFEFKKLKYGWMPPHPTLFIKKELVAVIQNYQLKYRIAADYDFILRLFSMNGIKSYYMNSIIVKMRVGGASNRNFTNIINKSLEDYLILRRNKIGGIGSLMIKNLSKLNQFFNNNKVEA